MSKDISVSSQLLTVKRVCRLGLGFLFIYHGLVPKILWLSKIEIALIELSGVGLSPAILSPIGGVLEIALGLAILFFRNIKYPAYVAAFALVSLLIYSAIILPSILVEAFNPVSTNILGLVLCYVVLKSPGES